MRKNEDYLLICLQGINKTKQKSYDPTIRQYENGQKAREPVGVGEKATQTYQLAYI